MGVRRCLARSLTSLAYRCALQRVQTVPAAIHSGRIPPSRQPSTRGSRRNQLRRGHGSPPVLSEVPHELSIPMRTPKSANGPRSNSFRPDSPSTTNFPRGRKTQPSPSPHRTWSVPDASSQPQLNLYFTHPLANCTAASKSGDDESFLHAMPTSFTIRSSSLSSVTPFRERERNSSEGRKAIPSPPWTI